MLVFLLPTVLAVGFLLTGAMRRYALARQLMDVPNARSSHQIPTPRGGGVSIVLGFLGALLFLFFWGGLPLEQMVALSGGGGVVALVGFLDDHDHIAARWRLLAHFAGAGWLLWFLGGLPSYSLFGVILPDWLWQSMAAFYLVWLLNLYNFMDGIDGIAGIEALSVCLGGALVGWVAVPGAEIVWGLPLVLAAASAGFLMWNFPPAKIFMGDAGSGFLGLMLGGLSLLAAREEIALFFAWLILLGVFVADATVTLLRRVFRGDRFYEAHRSHAYQHAARRYGKHRPVSLAVGMINLLWLLPLAILVATGGLDRTLGLAISYTPLLVLAFHFHAGLRD